MEIDRVIARYAAIAADLGLPDGATDDIAADLRARLAMATADAGLYLDTLKAAGEDNCAKLVATYLRARGVDAHYVDPRAAGMVLSEESGNARVLEEAYARLSTLRDLPGRLIFPGFFGYSRSG